MTERSGVEVLSFILHFDNTTEFLFFDKTVLQKNKSIVNHTLIV